MMAKSVWPEAVQNSEYCWRKERWGGIGEAGVRGCFKFELRGSLLADGDERVTLNGDAAV